MPPLDPVTVWDPLVRLNHWVLGAATLTALVTADAATEIHVLAGHLVAGLVLFRLAWGVLGTPHARFSDFVRPPQEILASLAAILRGQPPHHLGHNPAGGAMILALLATLLLTTGTGVALWGEREGAGVWATLSLSPRGSAWLEHAHEWLGSTLWILIGLHLTGVALGSVQHQENLAWSMITGLKRRRS
ncbi:MAG: cytochrome b/b6 domain-containing protein [Magnetococcus sp. WYHC-3]